MNRRDGGGWRSRDDQRSNPHVALPKKGQNVDVVPQTQSSSVKAVKLVSFSEFPKKRKT